MSMLSNPMFGPRLAVGYVTVGALIDVWTAVWYFAFAQPEETGGGLSNTSWFWVVGFFLTGLTLIILGLLIGPLGQYARKSELPPPEAEPYEQQIQQTAAATGAAVNGPQTVPENARAVPANNQPAPVATHQGQVHTRQG